MAAQAILEKTIIKPRDFFDEGKMDEEEFLDEFFALTLNSLTRGVSVWRVSSKKERNIPIVEKIAIIGQSPIPVGGKLSGGSFAGVMKSCILLYNTPNQKRQRPEEVNSAYWGGNTSPIAALFIKKDDAMVCLHSKGLKHCDPRWRKETEETLSKIGDNHPVFVLSISDPIRY